MRIAVLTLTRDRLEYTKHGFSTLRQFAGCAYDHYVLDNGSTDGTQEWLRSDYAPKWVELLPDNIGVSRGLNTLLGRLDGGYDVVVKFDNDCELLAPYTLAVAAEIAAEGDWLTSPHIQGLDFPPPVIRQERVLGYRVGVPAGNIGGIFLAAPASLFDTYTHSEQNPVWGMDDVNLCAHFRQQGGDVGYLLDYPANHYLTTQGQRRDQPAYFRRKDAEFVGR